MYVTADGGFSCPSSFPGEAAVHRIAQDLSTLPKRPKTRGPRPSLGQTLGQLASVVAMYKAGEWIGRGNHHLGGGYVPFVEPYPGSNSPADQVRNAAARDAWQRRYGQ